MRRLKRLAGVADRKLKIQATTAQEVCASFALSAEAQSHLDPQITPTAFLDLLIANSLYADAMQFLARALPKREAVWWSSTCVRDLGNNEKLPELAEGLLSAEAWVYRPTEENRRHAEKPPTRSKYRIRRVGRPWQPSGAAEVSAQQVRRK